MQSKVAFTVFPLRGIVSVWDSDAKSFPRFETGHEPAVATADAIHIATRDDAVGSLCVSIAVDDEEQPSCRSAWSIAFEGNLVISSGRLMVGNYEASDLNSVDIPSGTWHARILVDPPGEPSQVFVHLTPAKREDPPPSRVREASRSREY